MAARVRIPLGVLVRLFTVWSRGEAGVHAGLSSRRSRVRVPSGPLNQKFEVVLQCEVAKCGEVVRNLCHSDEPFTGEERCTPEPTSKRAKRAEMACEAIEYGRVAQSAEHTPEKRGVTGSTPVSTTAKANAVTDMGAYGPYR